MPARRGAPGISRFGALTMDTKVVVASVIVVLGVVGLVTLLPDLARYMKIRSM